MNSNIYDLMQKWKHIDLGQVFTPLHMSQFAAKLLDISENDVVIDTTAGSGALLLAAINAGCPEVYGIEYDPNVYEVLKDNIEPLGIKCGFLNADASSNQAAEWIKQKKITKAILNPPYEKKYNSAGIVLNTLNSLPEGCLVAMFHTTNFFDKLSKKQKEQLKDHRIEKVIQMPSNLFQPFVSVQTALYIIRANTPQENYKFYGYKIEDDGLRRKKGKYREDSGGTWENELEPKYYEIISQELDDDISTRQDVSEGITYRKPINTTPTAWDFYSVVKDYMDFKIKQEQDRREAEKKKLMESMTLEEWADYTTNNNI